MALERNLSAVPPVLLIANGTTQGVIQVTDTAGIYVKQQVVLQAPTLPPLNLEVKRVLNNQTIWVGPASPNMNHRSDVSAYTVALGSFLFATEQPKAVLPTETRLLSTYEQEPIDAWRTIPVDQYGNKYSPSNPLPISFDGTINIGAVEIQGPAPTNTPLIINPDGSITVVVSNAPSPNSSVVSTYNEVLLVASGLTTQLVTYTVPAATQAVLQRCPVSGENIARYDLLINGVKQDTIRTEFNGLNGQFDFTSGNDSGLLLNAGDVVAIQVLHNRPFVGNFEGRIQVLVINM